MSCFFTTLLGSRRPWRSAPQRLKGDTLLQVKPQYQQIQYEKERDRKINCWFELSSTLILLCLNTYFCSKPFSTLLYITISMHTFAHAQALKTKLIIAAYPFVKGFLVSSSPNQLRKNDKILNPRLENIRIYTHY